MASTGLVQHSVRTASDKKSASLVSQLLFITASAAELDLEAQGTGVDGLLGFKSMSSSMLPIICGGGGGVGMYTSLSKSSSKLEVSSLGAATGGASTSVSESSSELELELEPELESESASSSASKKSLWSMIESESKRP